MCEIETNTVLLVINSSPDFGQVQAVFGRLV